VRRSEGGIVLDDSNSNRKQDEFFTPPDENKQPKQPGAFTKAFLEVTGVPQQSTRQTPEVPSGPAESSPFTVQFGNVNVFAPIPGSSGAVQNTKVQATDAPEKPQFSGAFTRMFGANSAPDVPAAAPIQTTGVFETSPPGQSNPVPRVEPTPRLEQRPSAFTEAFGSSRSSSIPAATDADRTPSRDFFKATNPPDPGTPRDFPPLAPEAKPGEFTNFFREPQPPVSPSRSDGKSPSDIFFRLNNPSSPSSDQPLPNASPSDAGEFTKFFRDQEPAAPTPPPPKIQGDFTRMISGSDPALRRPSPPVGNANAPDGSGATTLFRPSDRIAAPTPSGPSDYTRVVSGRQLQDLQQGFPNGTGSMALVGAPPGSAPSGPTPQPNAAWPNIAAPNMAPPAIPAPQPAVPANPYPAPHWQAPAPPQMQPPQVAWQVPPTPNAPPVPRPPAPSGTSKIMQYLPLLIGLNVLFLIALLLIVIFALKR
jgi:hypothetical protein